MKSIAHAESLLAGTSREVREVQAQAAVQRGVIALHRGEKASALSVLQHAIERSRAFPSLYMYALVTHAYALSTRDHAEEAYATASQALELATLLHDTASIVRAQYSRHQRPDAWSGA